MLTPLPYTFSNGVSPIDANTTNANNQALQASVTSVDWTQIGSAGIYASQIVPTNSVQAIFGGASSITYTFPGAIQVGGNFPAYYAPVYGASGQVSASTEHTVRTTVSIPVASGTSQAQANVTLTNAAIFSSATSYNVFASFQLAGSTIPSAWNVQSLTVFVSRVSASLIQVYINNANVSTGAGTVNVDLVAMGY